MIFMQLLISVMTVISYWLVTHREWRRVGLWCGLMTELGWGYMFVVAELWGLLPVCIIMAGIAVVRLSE